MVGVKSMSRRMRLMCFSEARGFGVALHRTKDGYDVTVGNWWFPFLIDPPVLECLIWVYKESLFRCGCFGKSVGHISAIDEHVFHVFCSGNCVKDARSGPVNTVCICVV